MYVTIKYKCESIRTAEEERIIREVEMKLDEEFKKLGDEPMENPDDFLETYLHFESKEELDNHIDGMIEFLKDDWHLVVTEVELVDIPKEEYLEWVSCSLKHAICKRYADSIDLKFKSIRDETLHCKDKDFLIKAYEYALDVFYDNSDNPFAKKDIIV